MNIALTNCGHSNISPTPLPNCCASPSTKRNRRGGLTRFPEQLGKDPRVLAKEACLEKMAQLVTRLIPQNEFWKRTFRSLEEQYSELQHCILSENYY